MKKEQHKIDFDSAWKNIRTATGWTMLKDLADYIGVTSATVSNAKKRGVFPTDWLVRIALDKGLDIKKLMTGRDGINDFSSYKEGGNTEKLTVMESAVTAHNPRHHAKKYPIMQTIEDEANRAAEDQLSETRFMQIILKIIELELMRQDARREQTTTTGT